MEWPGHIFFAGLSNLLMYYIFWEYHNLLMALSLCVFGAVADFDMHFKKYFGHRNIFFHSAFFGSIAVIVTILYPEGDYLFTGYICIAMASHLLIDTAYKKTIVYGFHRGGMSLRNSRIYEFVNGFILLVLGIYCLWW